MNSVYFVLVSEVASLLETPGRTVSETLVLDVFLASGPLTQVPGSGVQWSTSIYNVIYTGKFLKIFKNVIYTGRYIYWLGSQNSWIFSKMLYMITKIFGRSAPFFYIPCFIYSGQPV